MSDTFWPRARLAELLAAAARHFGVPGANVGAAPLVSSDEEIEYLIERMAQAAGLEAEPVVIAYPRFDTFLQSGGPVLLALDAEASELALVVASTRRKLRLLGSDHRLHTVDPGEIRVRMCAEAEAPFAGRLDAMLDEIGVAPRRRARARRSLLLQWLSAGAVENCWLLRRPPSATLLARAAHESGGLVKNLIVATGAHVAAYALGVSAVAVIAQGFERGWIDLGWLYAAGLILLLALLFGVLANLTLGQLAIDVGTLIKQRLLAGTLLFGAHEMKHQGAGQLLGRVIESDAVETLALGGGAALVFSVIELVFAGAILFAAPAGRLAGLVLLAWIALAVHLYRRYARRRLEWTDRRLGLTHDLVERIVGHRTRLAQEPPSMRHQAEDGMLGEYLDSSRGVDAAQTWLVALIPRGWLIVGLLVVSPLLLSGGASVGQAVLTITGIVIGYRALRGLVTGMVSAAGAVIGWRQVAAIYRAAAESGSARLLLPPDVGEHGQPIVEVERLSFNYPSRSNATLGDVSLRVGTGERILLEGASGSGKSTFTAVLSGLLPPQHGTLWLAGLDWQTVGAAEWRRRVVLVPQFHENHVLTGTLAFNLLMGRKWPASATDRDEAVEVCEALGLGDLLRRMPGQLDEIVGETGWQLSHGERSRLFIARALLQHADVMLLDESFAALDPETLRTCLQCVLERSKTLFVVAHP